MNRRAFTLVETMVALALGAFIVLITGAALSNVTNIFRNTTGRDAALRDLAKARRALTLDLGQATLNQMAISPAPASLGGGADGDAVNFLSAFNVTSGLQATLQDGSGNAYFFQNIIYHPTVPTDHDTLFGSSCVGGNDGGYDYNCPHKMLVRVVEDQNPVYDPADSLSQDSLVPLLGPLLGRPTGFPKGLTRNTVAFNLLTFRVRSQPGELIVDLQAASIPDARRKLALGTTSLLNSSFTVQHQFSIFPKN